MRYLICIILNTFFTCFCNCQASISLPIVHSHNDYNRPRPFLLAYEAGVYSIEADVFYTKGELYIAHTPFQIKRKHTLEKLYLQPIIEHIRKGNNQPIQLLIDIKIRAKAALSKIIAIMQQYPDVFNECSPVMVVISGKRPSKKIWDNLPSYIYFDGRPFEKYTESQQKRIAMISDNFKHYKPFWKKSKWTNENALKNVVNNCHAQKCKIRLWNTPDNNKTWQRLISLGVDIINTDNPLKLNSFLNQEASLSNDY